MCRLIAYVGPERSVASLVLDGSHSLESQSYAPKMMEDALLNADGHGFAWYVPGIPTPARYRHILPMWADANVQSMAHHIRATHILGYVRSATPGIGMGLSNTQPFVHGAYAFTHNGYLAAFRDGTMRRIRRMLADVAYQTIGGTSDSEHLFALFVDAIERGFAPEAAIDDMIARAVEASEGRAALLAFAITDGHSIWATTEAHSHAREPTLFVDTTGPGTRIASEPTDDAAWERVPAGVRLHATLDSIATTNSSTAKPSAPT